MIRPLWTSFLALALVVAPGLPGTGWAAEGPPSEPLVLLPTRWTTIDGARPADGRGEASTIDRSLGAQVIWGAGGGTWGAGLTLEDRSDANLSPLPGGRIVPGFRSMRLLAFHSREISRGRRFQGFFSLRGGAEDPGDLSDALGGVLFLGRDRATSDTVRFGWGLVSIFRTGDGLRVFPAPTLEWDPPGGLSVSLRGPMSEVRYDLSKRWQLAITGNVNLRQYRLADDSLFVDRQFPVRLGLRRMIRGQAAFEVFAGRLLGREWEVLQRPGQTDATLDVDGGTFYGFQASIPLRLP